MTKYERGYDAKWRKYRLWYLKRHPLCVMCKKAPATDIDHIVTINGRDDPLFWVTTNHQGLCHPCHSKKTRAEPRRIV